MSDGKIWKDVLEAVDIPLFVVSSDRIIVLANQSVISLVRRLGFIERDTIVIGRPLFEAVPKLPSIVAARYDELFATGVAQEEERQFQLDDSVVWVRSNRFPVFSGKTVSHVITMLTDETALRAGQDALRKSEATARAIINSSTESIILLDRNKVLLAVNETAARRLGKPADELIGKTGKEMLPPEVWLRREPQLQQVIETGQPTTVRDTRGGIAFEFTMNPVLDENEKVSQVSIFASDITASVRAQEELIRIRQAVESSSDAIAMADADGNHVFSNKAFERLFGYSVEQLISAGGPRAAYKDSSVAASMFETIKSGTPWSGVVQMVTRDGQELLVALRADAIYDHERKLIGLIGIHTDVTKQQMASEQLRQSEEKCRLQFRSIPVPTFIWESVDDDFELKDYNLAAEELTKGVIAGFIGKRASEMYVTRPDIMADLSRCYKTQLTIIHEMPYRYQSIPEERYLRVNYVPIPPNLVLVHTVDLSEQKRIETELLSSRSTLEVEVAARTGELRKQIEFDKLVQRLLTSFASCQANEIDNQILEALRALADFTETDSAYTVLVSPDGATYSATHSWVRGNLPDYTRLYQNIPFGFQVWLEGKVLAAEPVLVRTITDYPPEASAERETHEREGIKSTLIVPLRGRGGMVSGALGLRSYTHTIDWIEEHVRWLRTIGDAVANVLERKQSEDARRMEQDKAELYLQTAEVILVALDTEGTITRINRKGCQILGYEENELVGRNWFRKCILLEHQDEVIKTAKKLFSSDATKYERFENQVLTKSGATRLIAWHNSLLHDKSGETIGSLSSGEDITDRKRSELELDKAYEQLQVEQNALQQKNIALQEMVVQIQESKRITAGQIQTNLDRIVLPVIERISQRLDPQGQQYLALVRSSMSDILSPFVSTLESQFKRLSPREIEICELIRRGYDSKQIADLRNSSVQTVLKQRKSIRKKLGLDQKKINLATYLSSSFPDQRKSGKKKNSFDKPC